MKIFSAKQLKEADRLTMERQNISSTELMERAATLVYKEIHARIEGADIPVKIFCGIGNNGGDGLVVGRMLLEQGYDVTIFVVNYSDQRSSDFLINYDRVKNVSRKWPVLLKPETAFPEIRKGDFVVDAIFGVGLNRPLPEWVGGLVQHINDSGAFVLAIDMPSGLMADAALPANSACIRASYTISFQAAKLSFFLPDSAGKVGEFQILDIGLDREYLNNTPVKAQLIGKQEARMLYRPRNKFSHKGTYGHVLMVGGSYGKIGSICLASTAALRIGAGMVTAYVPGCGYQILQTHLPEAMVLTDPNDRKITEITYDFAPSAIGFGVGVGTAEETVQAMEQFLRENKAPLVIDADGLNILSMNKDLLQWVPEASILTPHPKELQRLVGSWADDFEKLDKVKAFCREHAVIVVIKGAYTFVVTPEDMYINTSGNPGMATAGSGDVLTGLLTGLLGQGYNPMTTAIFGVFVHGRAGDLAAEALSFEGLTAGDIAAYSGPAILDLFKNENDQ